MKALGPALACVLLATFPINVFAAQDSPWTYFQHGCGQRDSLVKLWRCQRNVGDRSFFAREILKADPSGLIVLDGICDSPWHAKEKKTGYTGELLYDDARMTGTDKSRGTFELPLKAKGGASHTLVWRVDGFSVRYVGVR